VSFVFRTGWTAKLKELLKRKAKEASLKARESEHSDWPLLYIFYKLYVMIIYRVTT